MSLQREMQFTLCQGPTRSRNVTGFSTDFFCTEVKEKDGPLVEHIDIEFFSKPARISSKINSNHDENETRSRRYDQDWMLPSI